MHYFGSGSMLFFLCMCRLWEWFCFCSLILCSSFTGLVTTVRLFLFCTGLYWILLCWCCWSRRSTINAARRRSNKSCWDQHLLRAAQRVFPRRPLRFAFWSTNFQRFSISNFLKLQTSNFKLQTNPYLCHRWIKKEFGSLHLTWAEKRWSSYKKLLKRTG